MRGVTRTSIEALSTFNYKHHIAKCMRSIIRWTWPHPPSTVARSNPLCKQLYLPGRLDAAPVTHERKRNIIPRALKAVVGPRGFKTGAMKLHPTLLLPTCSQMLCFAKLSSHLEPRVRMRATNHNSALRSSRIENS